MCAEPDPPLWDHSIPTTPLDVPNGKFYFSDRNGRKILRANIQMPAGETGSSRTDLEEMFVFENLLDLEDRFIQRLKGNETALAQKHGVPGVRFIVQTEGKANTLAIVMSIESARLTPSPRSRGRTRGSRTSRAPRRTRHSSRRSRVTRRRPGSA